MIGAAVLYLVIIGVGSAVFKGRNLNITFLTIPHNLLMCLYSFYSFIGFADIMWTNFAANGYDWSLLYCDSVEKKISVGWDYWMYLFYLSKFAEYFDSFFLVLKGKSLLPPENSQFFLHVFHHTVTASIVYFAWLFPYSSSWTGPITNSFIHTAMYGYYFLAELNLVDRRLGGKFITPMQLLQFLMCMVFNAFESYFILTNRNCGSDWRVVAYMWFTYGVFFVFFWKIYTTKARQRTQTEPTDKKASSTTASPSNTKIKPKAD